MNLQIKKNSPNAIIPKRQSEKAAGYDLYSIDNIVIPSMERRLVNTGICIKIPDYHYGRIAPRSSLAIKSIDIGAGVIDPDYRGEIMILLINNSKQEFEIKSGTRIAQLILERISTPDVIEVESLEQTKRGNGGFGSTDKL